MSKRISAANRTSRRRRFLVEALEARCLLSITVYVDAIAPGPVNDGSSWANAYTSLQTALGAVVSGQTIEVGQGTYFPTTGTDRTATFQLIDGVTIEGGFAGYGTASPDARNVADYPTILSGDIGILGNNSDNSYHVVTGSGTNSTAVLDGFTVTAGSADGSGNANSVTGGGMIDLDGNPTLINCTFSGNDAPNFSGYDYSDGGGMFNDLSSPILNGCTFNDNDATEGGGIYNELSSPTLTNCTFSGNAVSNPAGDGVGTGGGGMYNADSSPTLTNCTFSGNMSAANVSGVGGDGDGMYNDGSSPILTSCTFSGNVSAGQDGEGGGVCNESSSPILTNCTFSGNSTNGAGGGMFNASSSPTLTNCTFSGNGSAGQEGGGMYNSGSSPILTNCTFTGNTALFGGGMEVDKGSTTLTNCSFIGNSASEDGGGLFITATLTESASPILTTCTFGGNTAGRYGGGVSTYYNCNPTLTNCAFIGNSAQDGGGMANWNSSMSGPTTLTNCTFSQNTTAANYGQGGALWDNVASATLNNCILWGDSGGEIYSYDGQATVTYSDIQGGYPGAGNLDGDPLFVNAGGGNVQLQAGSPCVNAGSNAAIEATGVTTDLAGNSRISGGVVDLGAYELQLATNTIYVDQSATSGGNNGNDWADAFTNLQAALAVAVPGNTIDVAQATYISPTLSLQDYVAIDGGFAGDLTPNPGDRNVTAYPTILSGNGTNTVVSGSRTNATAVLDGVTVTAGRSNYGAEAGGGMYNYYGNPTINDCTFTGNVAYGGGGGMYNLDSSPTLTDCVFSENHAGSNGGGAMYNQSSSPILTGCAFIANSVEGYLYDGGGMFNDASSSPQLIGCTFSDNTSDYDAGGMIIQSSATSLTNCAFSENSALFGGGLVIDGASPALMNCTFTGNTAADEGGGADINGSNTPLVYSLPTFTNCTFSENSAVYGGGGIFEYDNVDPTLINCVFVGNTAQGGGGIANDDGSPILTNCTFNGNASGTGQGGAISNGEQFSPVLTNCVLWGDIGGEFYNYDDQAIVTDSDIQGGYPGTGNVNTDPLFVNAAGGKLQLQPGSPCVNVGSNAAIPAGITTDLVGNPRIVDGVVDMGAYEVQSPAITWTGLGDGVNWSDGNNWSGKYVPTQNDSVTIPGGFAVVQVAGAAYSAGSIAASSPLEIMSTGLLQLYGSSVLNSPLTIDTGGTLDIQSNSLTINYAAGADPVATIRGYLKSAYAGGVWTGAGLTSSIVEGQVANAIKNPGGGVYAIGYVDGAVDVGQTAVLGNQLVIQPTIMGDSDVNGTTNFFDLGRLAQNLGRNTDWYHGDFNYDGTANFLDIGLLAQNLNKSEVNTVLGGVVSAGAEVVAASGVPVAKNPGIEISGRYLGGEGNMQTVVSGVWVVKDKSGGGLFGEETIGDLLG